MIKMLKDAIKHGSDDENLINAIDNMQYYFGIHDIVSISYATIFDNIKRVTILGNYIANNSSDTDNINRFNLIKNLNTNFNNNDYI